MEYFYDICGVSMRVGYSSDFPEPLPAIFKRPPLDADISVELKAGIDSISVDGIDWYRYDPLCLSYMRDDGGCLYEYSQSAAGKVFCRMETNPEYSKALIAFDEGALGMTKRWLPIMLKLLYNRHVIVRGGLVMHAASVLSEDGAILFSGPSGMGKSTQANLWIEYMNAAIINGDRTTLLFRSDELYATGSAWSGSNLVFTELAAPVKAIVFLEQAGEDTATRLATREILKNMIPRSYLPYYNSNLMDKAMQNIERMMGYTLFFKLRNTASVDSVRVLREALAGL